MGFEIGGKAYDEALHPPERGTPSFGHNWHVWGPRGALQILQSGDLVEWFANNPGEHFTINFANNSFAHIKNGDSLWAALNEVAKSYTVEVFPTCFHATYRPWVAADNDIDHFDCIKISARAPVP